MYRWRLTLVYIGESLCSRIIPVEYVPAWSHGKGRADRNRAAYIQVA